MTPLHFPTTTVNNTNKSNAEVKIYLFRVSRGSFLLIIPVSGSTVVKRHLAKAKFTGLHPCTHLTPE